MDLCYTIVPAAPLRASGSHRAEMVSQLLFGETAQILEEEGEFVRVACIYDGYEGWVQTRQVALYQKGPDATWVTPERVMISGNDSLLYLSPGSLLPLNQSAWQVGPYRFKLEQDVEDWPKVGSSSAETIMKTAQQYLGASYLWGGRSIWGLDCSGLTQSVFRIAGIKLQRDASQQAQQGADVGFLEEAKPGDLAFFDNENGRINHVGILTSSKTIIHASAGVRHDPIDHQGIIHQELKTRTHKLRFIKRMM